MIPLLNLKNIFRKIFVYPLLILLLFSFIPSCQSLYYFKLFLSARASTANEAWNTTTSTCRWSVYSGTFSQIMKYNLITIFWVWMRQIPLQFLNSMEILSWASLGLEAARHWRNTWQRRGQASMRLSNGGLSQPCRQETTRSLGIKEVAVTLLPSAIHQENDSAVQPWEIWRLICRFLRSF